MPTTTGSSFGDVVLVAFPFTNQSGTKQRPAVVVSSNAYQRQRPDLSCSRRKVASADAYFAPTVADGPLRFERMINRCFVRFLLGPLFSFLFACFIFRLRRIRIEVWKSSYNGINHI